MKLNLDYINDIIDPSISKVSDARVFVRDHLSINNIDSSFISLIVSGEGNLPAIPFYHAPKWARPALKSSVLFVLG